jgi:hypothetical protein
VLTDCDVAAAAAAATALKNIQDAEEACCMHRWNAMRVVSLTDSLHQQHEASAHAMWGMDDMLEMWAQCETGRLVSSISRSG